MSSILSKLPTPPPSPNAPAPSGGDDTAALSTFLAGGGVRTFPSGANYIIDGTVSVSNLNGLTVNGNGATFTATTQGNRTRSHFRFDRCSNVTVNDVTINGAHPDPGPDGTYDPTKEAQHGLELWSCTNVTINRATVRNVWGDFVYIGQSDGTYGRNSGVIVRDCDFAWNGRQDISITAGENVLIERCVISQVRRSMFDLEPNFTTGGVINATIQDCTVGSFRLSFLACKGYDSTVHGIIIRRCIVTGTGRTEVAPPVGGERRGPFLIEDNQFSAGYGTGTTGGAVFSFADCDGVAVQGNAHGLQPNRNMWLVNAIGCTGLDVTGNTIYPVPPPTGGTIGGELWVGPWPS